MAVKQRLLDLGFSVHKEELGTEMTSLGHLVGGWPPGIVGSPCKQWLAIECLWELSQQTRALPTQVESVVSLATWLAMVARGLLSVLDQTYEWTHANRHSKAAQVLPQEVRSPRELVALSALFPWWYDPNE